MIYYDIIFRSRYGATYQRQTVAAHPKVPAAAAAVTEPGLAVARRPGPATLPPWCAGVASMSAARVRGRACGGDLLLLAAGSWQQAAADSRRSAAASRSHWLRTRGSHFMPAARSAVAATLPHHFIKVPRTACAAVDQRRSRRPPAYTLPPISVSHG